MKLKAHIWISAVTLVLTHGTYAAVSPEEAKQLGTTLTPWGAEKAGNKEGTIPEWTGQVKIPANYDPKTPGLRPDPFTSEKPLFSINAQNMDKHANKLSEGIREMMKKFPTFRIDVYSSHRTADYPKYIVDNTIKNATSCKSLEGGNKIDGCYGGLPFPIPKTGAEAMWNHNLTYKSSSWYARFTNWYIDTAGKKHLQSDLYAWQEQPYYDPARTGPAPANQMYWRYRQLITGPAHKAGNALLLMDPVDTINVGRRIWQYVPGQRRIKLAPDLAYDTPTPESGGSQNMDDAQVFLGALDRFDWKLAGKREMYIPYNAFGFADPSVCNNDKKFTRNHLNPDCVRWELHRVWAVEGTLRSGFRHVYKTRKFYWDEDAPGSGIGDNFDAAGKIYRVSYNMGYPLYETKSWMPDTAVTVDVQTGVYAISGEVAETGGWYPIPKKPPTFFTPDDVAAGGVR